MNQCGENLFGLETKDFNGEKIFNCKIKQMYEFYYSKI